MWLLAFAVVLVGFAAVAAIVVVRVRRLARLTARIEADPLEPRSTFPTVVVVPARHVRTALLASQTHADWLTLPPGTRGELGLTDRELLLSAEGRELLRLPVKRLVDAAFVKAVEDVAAGNRLVLLRLVWQRGGERLSTTFALEVPWASAEKLRREIHLRIALARSSA